MDHFRRTSRSLALLTAVMATPVALTAPACAEDSFKLGIVTFLSGPAAIEARGLVKPWENSVSAVA